MTSVPAASGVTRPATAAAIDMIGVHKWYGEFHVLKNINLSVGAWREDRDLRPLGLW